jgi:ribonuclease P protein subunit RPR2
MEALAAWAVRGREPLVLLRPLRFRLSAIERAADPAQDVLAIPAAGSQGRACILAVLRVATGEVFNEEDLAVATAAAGELALLAEHYDLQEPLGARLDEATLAKLQLEAYAHDIRQTFAAEKQRSEELSLTLTELQTTYVATVSGLAIAVEAKDGLTAGHIARVTRYGLALLELILPDQVADRIYEYGFLLHDIGKLSVPDAILGKRGPLAEDEWTIMRRHCESGRRILEGIPFLERARDMVYAHHERWDGNGYPLGLTCDEIPVGSRLFPVVDSYDAMTSDRPYRQAMPVEDARAEIRLGSGTQYWPYAVDAFLSLPLGTLEGIRTGPTEWTPQMNSRVTV